MGKHILCSALLFLFCHNIQAMSEERQLRSKITNFLESHTDTQSPEWIEVLCIAASHPTFYDLLKLILEKGVNPNQGQSPALYNACYNGALDNVIILLNYKADPNMPDRLINDTPLMVSLKYFQIFKVLLENGANPDQQDMRGRTALMYACTKHMFYTLAKGRIFHFSALSNADDANLKKEAKITCRKFICTLLIAGARIDVKNDEGITAIDLIQMNDDYNDIIDLMLNYTPQAPTLADLCFRTINKNKSFFKAEDFDRLPNELKELIPHICQTRNPKETN